jgi:V8-like Glu-specific endopeptidase
MKHKLSSFPGNSGAPLLVKRGNKLVAIGIHKGEYYNINANVARIITNDLLLDLMKWEK